MVTLRPKINVSQLYLKVHFDRGPQRSCNVHTLFTQGVSTLISGAVAHVSTSPVAHTLLTNVSQHLSRRGVDASVTLPLCALASLLELLERGAVLLVKSRCRG